MMSYHHAPPRHPPFNYPPSHTLLLSPFRLASVTLLTLLPSPSRTPVLPPVLPYSLPYCLPPPRSVMFFVFYLSNLFVGIVFDTYLSLSPSPAAMPAASPTRHSPPCLPPRRPVTRRHAASPTRDPSPLTLIPGLGCPSCVNPCSWWCGGGVHTACMWWV